MVLKNINLTMKQIALSFASMLILSTGAFAACSPGIPCTDYNIYTNTTSGTDAALNGPKTGQSATQYDQGACDGNFMNQIYSRAFLEASRDVIMSEQIIHKPDSVLEYTCFDQIVGMAADAVGPVFTENTYWDNDHTFAENSSGSLLTGDDSSTDITVDGAGLGSNYMDDSLETLLYSELNEYITKNFSHTYLGGALTLDNNITSSAMRTNTYNCSHMKLVWDVAKCLDFAEDDRFRSFEHLASYDPRTIPSTCSPASLNSSDSITATASTKLDNTSPASINPSGNISTPCPTTASPTTLVTGINDKIIKVSNNCDASASQPDSYASMDTMKTHTDLIKGLGQYLPGVGNSTGTVLCSTLKPMPTGLPVITYTYGAPYDSSNLTTVDRDAFIHYEHFCTNPGCFYYQPVKAPYVPLAPLPPMTTAGTCIPIP